MYIRFKNDNIPTRKKNEITIDINGNKNKLSYNKWKYYNSNTTFDYTLYDDSELNIIFSKGTYNISNIDVITSYSIHYTKLYDIFQIPETWEVLSRVNYNKNSTSSYNFV